MLLLHPHCSPLLSPQTVKSKPNFSFSRLKSRSPNLLSSISHPKLHVSSTNSSSAAAASVEENSGSLDAAHLHLPKGLRREALPRHVAVIMDGNGRWARAQGLPPSAGHEAGVKSLKDMVKRSCEWGIKVLTVFAFSSENWLRPKAEVDFLISLFENVIRADIENFVREDIRLCVIGDSSKLPESLQKLINEAEEMTRYNARLDLMVAVSYSGREDIVQACQKIASRVKNGVLDPADITESIVEQELETNAVDFPSPDLLIRTSGELRVSNFLLWQLAYTELFFAQSLWPDFGEAEYMEALHAYQNRRRRFGLRDVPA